MFFRVEYCGTICKRSLFGFLNGQVSTRRAHPIGWFDTTELSPIGICAEDSVEFLSPYSRIESLRPIQSCFNSTEVISSTSFLYVSIGRVPLEYLVQPSIHSRPFSLAQLVRRLQEIVLEGFSEFMYCIPYSWES